jgi:hypothetical protein
MLAPLQSDPRLLYHYVAGAVSSFDNFVDAVGAATGEYIAVIGDDDVVNPEIIAATEWARSRGIDAFMSYAWAANYYWPDFQSIRTGVTDSATLVIRKFSGNVTRVSPSRELKRCLRVAGIGMQRLPKLYLGVVRRAQVSAALELFGGRQFGTCPDMFFAVALAAVCHKVVEFDYPLIVPGASSRSTAGAVAMKKHQGDLGSAPHLRDRAGYKWPTRLPRFYSYETFYAESALAAVLGTSPQLAGEFNFGFLYLLSLRKYPAYRAEVREAFRAFKSDLNARGRSVPVELIISGCRLASQVLRKGVRGYRLRRRGVAADMVYRGVVDTLAATHTLSRHLRARSQDVARYLK